jgi:hypothetical protein
MCMKTYGENACFGLLKHQNSNFKDSSLNLK